MKYKLQIIILMLVLILSVISFSDDKSTIILFFFDDSRNYTIVDEKRNVNMPEDIIQRMKIVIENLIGGSKENLINVIPENTKLKELFLDKPNKIVYIDFSEHIRKNHISGTTAEISTIQSIFKTLQINFPQTVNMVQILINGSEIDTLSGHIALSRPLPIDIFESQR